MLRPVRRPVTALDWVPLKDRNLAWAPRQGPEISSQACLRVPPRLHHRTRYWLTDQRLILLCTSCLETPRAGSGPRNPRTEPPFPSSSAISLPHTPACPGTQYSPTTCPVEISYELALTFGTSLRLRKSYVLHQIKSKTAYELALTFGTSLWLRKSYVLHQIKSKTVYELALTFGTSLRLSKSYILHQIKSKTDIVDFLVKILGCKVEAV